MAKKPVTSRTGRFFKLAGMTASVAGQYAGQRARRMFRTVDDEGARSESYTRMAGEIADTLGELKGAVMKVGQIASQTQDFLPKEFSQALEKLQKEAPPMPFDVILAQVESELGKPVGELFEYLQETPTRPPPLAKYIVLGFTTAPMSSLRFSTPALTNPATPI